MALRFANETDVDPDRSRAEILAMLRKVGATRFGFVEEMGRAQIGFEFDQRRYRFAVELPELGHPFVAQLPGGKPRPHHLREGIRNRLVRIRWRTLVLGVKARLAEVEVGVSSFDSAFLGDMILPTGRTVAEETRESIALAYQGRNVPLLPGAAHG